MFNIIQECFRASTQPTSQTNKISQGLTKHSTLVRKFGTSFDVELPDPESFNYMTLGEAEKQHRLINKNGQLIGDMKTAYKCFETYAKLGQINAKFYKAYYLSKGYVGGY